MPPTLAERRLRGGSGSAATACGRQSTRPCAACARGKEGDDSAAQDRATSNKRGHTSGVAMPTRGPADRSPERAQPSRPPAACKPPRSAEDEARGRTTGEACAPEPLPAAGTAASEGGCCSGGSRRGCGSNAAPSPSRSRSCAALLARSAAERRRLSMPPPAGSAWRGQRDQSTTGRLDATPLQLLTKSAAGRNATACAAAAAAASGRHSCRGWLIVTLLGPPRRPTA